MPHLTAVPENWERGESDDDSNKLPKCETCGKKLNGAWNYCPRCGREQTVNIPDYF